MNLVGCIINCSCDTNISNTTIIQFNASFHVKHQTEQWWHTYFFQNKCQDNKWKVQGNKTDSVDNKDGVLNEKLQIKHLVKG